METKLQDELPTHFLKRGTVGESLMDCHYYRRGCLEAGKKTGEM